MARNQLLRPQVKYITQLDVELLGSSPLFNTTTPRKTPGFRISLGMRHASIMVKLEDPKLSAYRRKSEFEYPARQLLLTPPIDNWPEP